MERAEISGYRWNNAELNASHDYLLPAVRRELQRLKAATEMTGGGDSSSLAAATAVWRMRSLKRAGK